MLKRISSPSAHHNMVRNDTASVPCPRAHMVKCGQYQGLGQRSFIVAALRVSDSL
jgi:hypothetical protein